MKAYVICDKDDWCGEAVITVVDSEELAERICDWNGGESYYEVYDTDEQRELYERFMKDD